MSRLTMALELDFLNTHNKKEQSHQPFNMNVNEEKFRKLLSVMCQIHVKNLVAVKDGMP